MLLIIFVILSGCLNKNRQTPVLLPHCRTNRPYKIKNKLYIPQQYYELTEIGMASYYGISDGFHKKRTASGEIFDAHKCSAAHRTLPLPCIIKVTNLSNNRWILVRVNDRGPFAKDRILDVSEAAAKKLGFHRHGCTKVKIETMVPETIEMIQGKKKTNIFGKISKITKYGVKVVIYPFNATRRLIRRIIQ